MLLLLLSSSNLMSKQPLLFDSLNLRNDVIVQPTNRDRNPGSPLVPESRHTALEGDGPSSSRVGSHYTWICHDNPRASVDPCISDKGKGAEAPVVLGLDPKAGAEKADAGEEADMAAEMDEVLMDEEKAAAGETIAENHDGGRGGAETREPDWPRVELRSRAEATVEIDAAREVLLRLLRQAVPRHAGGPQAPPAGPQPPARPRPLVRLLQRGAWRITSFPA